MIRDVKGSGFRIYVRFRVWDLGFKVSQHGSPKIGTPVISTKNENPKSCRQVY